MTREAAEVKSAPIHSIFNQMVTEVQKVLIEKELDTAVDVQLHFKSLAVHKNRAIFSTRKNNTQLEIKLAARITAGNTDKREG